MAPRLPQRICADPRRHDEQSWCLTEAVKLGQTNAILAGLNPEWIGGHLAGFWRVMDCGCVLAVVVVPERAA